MPKPNVMPKSKPTNTAPPLNEKQTLFVQAYAAGQSAYNAACHAGYSSQNAKSTARRLLQNSDIQTALQNLKPVDDANQKTPTKRPPSNNAEFPNKAAQYGDDEAKDTSNKEVQESAITPEDVVRELAAIGFTSMNDICSWSEDGVVLRHSDDIPNMANAAIAEVRESGTARGGVLVKMHSKLRALEMLGRHLGMFSAQVASSQSVHNGLAFEAAQALFDDEDNALPEAILQKLNAVYGHATVHSPRLNKTTSCDTAENIEGDANCDDFTDNNFDNDDFEADDYDKTYDQLSAFH